LQIEAFTSWGRSLWRRNLSNHDHCWGNANNVPFNVWDMDGDGKAEVITFLQQGEASTVAILDGMTGKVKYSAPWTPLASDFQKSSTRIMLSVVCLDGKNPAVITQSGLYEKRNPHGLRPSPEKTVAVQQLWGNQRQRRTQD
jgi:hypothetical protein